MISRILMCAVWLSAPVAAFAQTTTYTYNPVGQTFTDVAGTYVTSMSVTGFFQTANRLPAGLGGADISGDIVGYSFSDGVQTLNDGNSYIVQAVVSTDGSGRLMTWGLTFYRDNGGVVGGMDIAYSLGPPEFLQIDGFTDAPCGIGTPDDCQGVFDFGPNYGLDFELQPQDIPGRWSITGQLAPAIPTLSTWAMAGMVLLLAVVGLNHLRR
jgi:hypothetical protein